MKVKNVGIVGSGQVGTTIATVWLNYGRSVTVRDVAEPVLQKARATIEGSLERRVTRGDITPAQKEETMSRLKTTTKVADLKNVDWVVEAASENIALKKSIFAELDAACSPKTVLTTNSSSIPISTIAAATKRPDRCAKMHFWYPATAMTYMEISRGYLTSDEVWETLESLAKELGRKPIRIVKDYQGLGNQYRQMEIPPRGGVWWELMMGKTTLEEVEARPKGKTPEGFAQVLNWMEMQDFIGLDTMLGIAEAAVQEWGAAQSYPCPLHRRMVEAGHLGQKTGIGFYDYSESPRKAIMGKFSPYLVKFLAKDPE
ncbi:MAG: 3-hydroxybutyryl-CoA dehydrogenase, partial [Chloroflexi bacterium]|nr:3-hydroxybutyryl-CoA dehydrogenase [Chloroflexota bacterium]